MDAHRKSAIPTRSVGLTPSTVKSFNAKRLSDVNTASPNKRILPRPSDSPLNQPARRQSLSTPRILNAYGLKTTSTTVTTTKKNVRRSQERIKVCVRKRPTDGGEREIVQLDAQSVTVECTKMGLDGYSRSNGLMKFYFDHVFDERHSNESVLHSVTYDVV